jgi:histidine phosphotransferase ChpT
MSVELNPRVVELVASRICHDLVSPVGAISNGVELMQEMGDDAGEEAVTLISTSAQQASIRLKCFRLAYGAAGTDKNVGFRDIRDVFLNWLTSGRIEAEFEQGLEVKYSMPPRGFFKCLLNLMMLVEECSRGEGKISVTALEAGKNGIKVAVAGKQVGFREGAEAALRGETSPDDLDPRSVHAYITGKFAQHFGFKLEHQAQTESGRLELQLSY